ncbi:class I SAM-dependent methyltransferase [soil metagenome]
MSSPRLHKTLVTAVVQLIKDIVPGGQYAEKGIEQVISSNPKWGSRDRSFIVETTIVLVRNYRLATYLSGQEWGSDNINHWHLFGAWWLHDGFELPQWPEFEGLDKDFVDARFEAAQRHRAIFFSLPDWLDELGVKELGADAWLKELAAMHQSPSVVLRVNTFRISPEKLAERLAKQEIETYTLPWAPDALVLAKRKHLMNLPEFKEGLFEIQDAASQLVVPLLQLKPGQMVIDACAGAGGKTLQIADLMRNQGRIAALEPEAIKLKNTDMRSKRAGFNIIQSVHLSSPEVIKQYTAKADRLLLDVPCSGLGVLKRNADAKWKLTLAHVQEVEQLQQRILTDYWPMLKPSGIMVYATCSILPSEDEKQVEHFLEDNTQFELLQQQYYLPSEWGFDGFYAAVLQRKK